MTTAIFPLEPTLHLNRELGLVLAVLIGFGFGFVLERAGFGRSTKLAAQFYLHDMTVFKVMFGAIVTAMLGMAVLAGVGLLDVVALREAAASSTYLAPMIVGGFLLGAGFIISGYCPGTSCVGIASGHLDALFAFGGVILGSLIYGELYPAVAGFHNATDLGQLFLYELVGVPLPVLALGVTLMAVGCFVGAEVVERIFTRKRTGEEPPPPDKTKRLWAFGALGALAALGLVTLAIPTATQAEAGPAQAEAISAAALSRRVLDEPWKLRILDLRAQERCAEARVPGAECVPAAEVDKLGLRYAPPVQDLVVYGEDGDAPTPAAALVFPGRVLTLVGGFQGWREYALTAPPPPGGDADAPALEEYRVRAALHSALTGRAQAPPPPTPSKAFVPKKKKKGGGCS